MLLGDVVGRLWASQRAGGLPGQTLLLVRPLDARGPSRRLIVAVDRLGAGPGERVLVAHGSRVRDLTVGAAVPDKDIVVAIVDDHHVDAAAAGGAGR
ncbi:MAG TPA: EutN/CcmL family microcompartment protein [Polyangia bacterium]|nr:EutN/CcmL family microcompartment protein [Polyangia bacterium]